MTIPAQRPPFRADHVGSLLRPATLRAAFRDLHAGRISAAQHDLILDEAVREIARLQQQIGLQVVNDGEFRRGSYWGRFVELTEGLSVKPAIFRFHDDHGHESGFTAPFVAGKVARRQPIAVDEVSFLRTVTNLPIKVTLPAPSTMHLWRGKDYAAPGVYDSPEEFFADLAAVYRAEIRDLAKAGAGYIQLDEVALAMLCDPRMREQTERNGESVEQLADLYIAAINQVVANRPPGIVMGVHMCRGNYKGQYLASGGYDAIAEKLFQRADVDHFLLEFDTPRAGDFSPLRFLPANKGVVLGLVSSKSPELESADALRRRIDEAARFVDLGRLGISPQCGFASTVAGNPITEAVMQAKLRLVVETARAVWG